MRLAKEILSHELKKFETTFNDSLRSETRMLDLIMKYLVKSKGKQLRPMFVFLCAKMHGEVNESTYRAATLVELLHTATLVHDDVVDDASTRRGFFSINYLWKKKVAVLAGDYLLAKGLLLATDHKEFDHLQILSSAVRQMSEGELLQIEKSRKLNLSEEIYFEIIRKKTASLLASSCAVGAFSTTSNHSMAEQMHLFGEVAGIAFQIKDDLLDYGNSNIGKPTGNDIQEKKLTLPLIHTLQNVDKTVARRVKYILKNKNKDAASVNFVLDTVRSTGSIEYAEQRMIDYRDKALQLLLAFPKSAVRDALDELVRYLTDRTH